MPKKSYNTMELTSQEIQEKIRAGVDICLVPVGSHEMHGYHCPVGCDSYQALAVAEGAAAKANVLTTPVVWLGYSPHHMHHAGEGVGTLSSRGETLRRVLYDIAMSLIYTGFNKIIYVNYHGSNIKVMDELMRKIKYETGAFVACYQHSLERGHELFHDIIEKLPKDVPPAWHSGQCETSLLLSICPDLVKMDRAVRDTAHAPKRLTNAFNKTDGTITVEFQGAENIAIPMEHDEYCNSATIGDPFRATKELGDELMRRMVNHCADFIEEVKKMQSVLKVERDACHTAW
jgi:creatinine amidohydrolase